MLTNANALVAVSVLNQLAVCVSGWQSVSVDGSLCQWMAVCLSSIDGTFQHCMHSFLCISLEYWNSIKLCYNENIMCS